MWRALALHLAAERDDPHSLAADALAASSTDQPEEDVRNVLFPRSRPPPGSSTSTYWSSAGSPTPDTHESVSLRLAHPLCLVRSITLRPFRAWFQPGAPVYAPRGVRVRVGRHDLWGVWGEGVRAEVVAAAADTVGVDDDDDQNGPPSPHWAYTSPSSPVAPHGAPQTIVLNPPVLVPGGHLNLLLEGRRAVQEVDGRFYICLAHVRIHGRALTGLKLDAATGILTHGDTPDPLISAGGLAAVSELGRPARLAARRDAGAAALAAGGGGDADGATTDAATDNDGGSDDDDDVAVDPGPLFPPPEGLLDALQRALAAEGGGEGGGAPVDGGLLRAVMAAFRGALPGAGPPPGGHAPRGGGGGDGF